MCPRARLKPGKNQNMEPDNQDTLDLLQRWHGGDQGALQTLIEHDLPWIHQVVRKRVGPLLRSKEETCDVVQEVLIELLHYGPRFLLSNHRHFRALLARIAENVIRGQNDRFTAARRAAVREKPLPSDSVLYLDQPQGSLDEVEKKEAQDLVRLSMELLAPEDRDVILWRQWDSLSYKEIGDKLSITEDAARMRFHRSISRLSHRARLIEQGRVHELLDPEDEGEVESGPPPQIL